MTWVSIILANYFEKKYPELKENLPEWSKNKFHIAFHIIYFCFLMGSRIYFGFFFNLFILIYFKYIYINFYNIKRGNLSFL